MVPAQIRVNPLKIAASVLICAVLMTNGCVQRIWERDDDAALRMEHAPKMMLEAGEHFHLLVMQAPSPGWSVRLDSTERTPDGKRVYLTIREPDPAYVYTQQIVLMRVLTNVRLDTDIQVVGRMLEYDEKSKRKGYAPVALVESFE